MRVTIFQKKSFCFFTLLAFLVGLGFVLLYLRIITIYPIEAGSIVRQRLVKGIQQTLEHLELQGNELAQDPYIIQALLERDDYALLSYTKEEVVRRNIGMVGVADKNGIILSRSLTSAKRGDNAFLTGPIGRALLSDDSTQNSVENTKFNGIDQVFFTTGRFVYLGSEKIGALFANQLADDAFARKFRDAYLPKSEVVFYTVDGGVYGSSFDKNDPVLEAVQNIILPEGEWVLGEDFVKIITLNHELYLVRNAHIQGLEGIATGVSVFTPLPWLDPLIYIAPLVILLSILSFFPIRLIMKGHLKGWVRRLCVTLYFAQILFWALVITLIWLNYVQKYRYLDEKTFSIYNSVLSLKPESGVFLTNTEQKVDIYLHAGEEINAYQIDLQFDPIMIEPKSLAVIEGACPLSVARETGVAGLISFSCTIPLGKSDFGDGKVATFVFEGRKAGVTSISFASTTAVYANDGLATSVLRADTGAQYTFQDVLATRKPSLFYSFTHPNENRWYKKDVTKVVWQPADEAMLTLYTKSGERVGNKIGQGRAEFFLPHDGEYIIAVSDLSGKERLGEIVVKKDTTPPEPFKLKSSSLEIDSGDVIRFEAKASDATSGLQRMVYVQINEGIFYPTRDSFSVPFESKGNYRVTVKVFDLAGNSREAHVDVKVR